MQSAKKSSFTTIFFQPIFRGVNIEHLSRVLNQQECFPCVLSLGLMLCALYISFEEEAHTDAVTEKTKEAASGYVTSLGMIRGGYNHLRKTKKTYGIGAFLNRRRIQKLKLMKLVLAA